MQSKVQRRSVDLAGYPDLVVILLGFRVRGWRGLRSMMAIGPGLQAIARDMPEGLLAHEGMLFGWNHVGFRQYWRDFESLERFTRSAPHAEWWRRFGADPGGAGFWHETYCRSGRMEAVYLDMPAPQGFGHFAPALDPTGPMLSARARRDRTALAG